MRSGFMKWLAVAAFATVAACNGEHVGTTGGGTRILLTDAPFPFDQVCKQSLREGRLNPFNQRLAH